MISSSPDQRVEFFLMFREAGRSAPMMAADRSNLSRRAILFLLVSMGLPSLSHAANLEDSAKEFARKIAMTLPAGENAAIQIRNRSSLHADEVSRIDQAVRAELQDRGIHSVDPGVAPTSLIVTLSENWKEYVWTGEIRQGETSRAVLFEVPRAGENHFVTNAMHITVRSEKFWDGPQRVLDAAEASNGNGKSWLVLLLPLSLSIQDLQTGVTGNLEIAPAQTNTRDPWGQLATGQTGSMIWFETSSQVCKADLEARTLGECLPKPGAAEGTTPSRFPFLVDVVPAGPPPPGKGIELSIAPVCGGTGQFLASSARDYTQTDSLQVFQTEPSGPVAMSGELDFPGPIVALHTSLEAPRAIVRNLTTGNYEAYNLAISCGQ